MTDYNFDCVYFTGYKPCKFKRPCKGCPTYTPAQSRIAVVSLEALGAVLRSTCLLEPIRRKYPDAHITWITLPSAVALLRENSLIDRLLTVEAANLPLLSQLQFDVVFSVDKSAAAGGLAQSLQAKRKFGFGVDRNGVITPLSHHADYQFHVGLDDQLKFFENQKPETQQITETMGLEWKRDEYVLDLTDDERSEWQNRRADILRSTGSKRIIGYNTGCSFLYPYKKLTVEHSIELIRRWRRNQPEAAVVLLGGKEDSDRQREMKEAFAADPCVVNAPTAEGLRSGILWMATADVVFSGDSLGMHIAIALKKPTVAWFGVSCIQEIDLYDRGVKLAAEVACSPCWKRACSNEPKCFNRVNMDGASAAIGSLL